MALGSSAPEILLSIIEIFGNKFEAGDLGPNTIVGSAAYNLFVIIGYCILVVPKDEIRRIKHLRVFFVTATWSVFAYIWLYLIIAVFSKGVIDVWEAFLTFLFFPMTVLSAYVVDTKIFFGNFLEKKLKSTKLVRDEEAGNVDGANGHALKAIGEESGEPTGDTEVVTYTANPDVKQFEENRKEYINILKELRQKNPDIGIDELQQMAEIEILKRGPKSRAFYRVQATRKLIGNTNNLKKKLAEKNLEVEKKQETVSNVEEVDPHLTSISFEPAHYTCFESVGSLELYVTRSGGDLNKTVLVDFKTQDGSAQAHTDYEYAEGTLCFYPNETRKHFIIRIIDDDVYEEDEHFYVRLSNARYQSENSKEVVDESTLKVVHPDVATVMILDDDHNGVFIFPEAKMEVIENVGRLRIKVLRTSGARGKVKVPYHTIDYTALGGKDYEKKNDTLVFYNNEIE